MRLMKGFEARGEQGKRSKLSRSLTGLYPQEHHQSEVKPLALIQVIYP